MLSNAAGTLSWVTTLSAVLLLQVALGVAHRQAAAAQTQPSGALVKRSARGLLSRWPTTSSQSRSPHNQFASCP